MEADLFAQGLWNAESNVLDYSRGVDTYPLPLQSVYLTTADELETLFVAAEHVNENDVASPLVALGEYVGANGATCRANIDKLFGQHCAILGSTGSGKSGTVAAVIHSVLEHRALDGRQIRPRIVLIDPHGEYAAAFRERAVVYRAYDAAAPEAAQANALQLPYWLMSGDELRGLIVGKGESEATSQNNIVFKALKHARMVAAGIVQPLPADGVVGDRADALCEGKTVQDIAAFDRDRPIKFSLTEFRRHVDEVQGRKTAKTDNLSTSDRKSLDSLLDKLDVLVADPRLRFLMDEHEEASVESVLAQLIGVADGQPTVRIIDISGLRNEVAGPLAAAISRLLFSYKVWQTRAERDRDPVLLVCEEAHRYVPDRGEAQYREAQDAIRRIAREGRKYGLGLMLVSQRPSDVESTVLSQCNSWVVLRLSNGSDQEHVGRFLPDSLAGLTRILSSLSRREAIFVGEAAALPARIRIRELESNQVPDSADIRFSAGWAAQPLEMGDIQRIVARWTKIE
ncbi:ATP-binding protein [Burkholderia cepacia]|uniref:ATP-binding protein n=1 Tax=Burkholderia cepacia TaxID=292 RepID=UPI00158C1E0E|nr:ATP-binding protein [Burkholderia cepacia]